MDTPRFLEKMISNRNLVPDKSGKAARFYLEKSDFKSGWGVGNP